MKSPVIILGTGRCGSTLLSDIIRQHPKILSISEFFSCLATRAFNVDTVDGTELWDRLSNLSPIGRVLQKNGLIMSEFLYPLGPDARFAAGDVPPLLCTALPHLTEEHEALFDKIAPVIQALPEGKAADHYRFIFEWLGREFERDLWIERSGGSLLWVRKIHEYFPDARFIHVYRDGRDTALSMEKHHYFRIKILANRKLLAQGLDPFDENYIPATSRFMPFMESMMFKSFDIEEYKSTEIELDEFAAFWNSAICKGNEYLRDLSDDTLLNLSFEEICNTPKAALEKLGGFIGEEYNDRKWIDDTSKIPGPSRSKFQKLPAGDQERLTEICRDGLEILGYL